MAKKKSKTSRRRSATTKDLQPHIKRKLKKVPGGKGKPRKIKAKAQLPKPQEDSKPVLLNIPSSNKEQLSEGKIANNPKIRKGNRQAQTNQTQGRRGPKADFAAPAVQSRPIAVQSYDQLRIKDRNNIPFLFGVTNTSVHRVPQQQLSAPEGGRMSGRI